MSALHIRLLGDFCVTADEVSVPIVISPRLQSLFALLLLHRGIPQSRRRLAYTLYPDSGDAQAHGNLRNLVYLLRRSLPEPDLFLHSDAQTLLWLPDAPFTLDVADFETAATQGALEDAIASYRGDLLPACYDDWIVGEREHLQQMYIAALEQLVQRLESDRQYRLAIDYAECLLQSDPLCEETYRCLMRLHAQAGEPAAALRVYHTCATALQRELDVEPGQATRAVYESLLKAETDSPAGRTGTNLPPASVPTLPLVGRKQEWGHLLDAWRAAAGGSPQMVVLAGEAGIGKTRLAEELAAWVSRQGIKALSAYCYAAEGSLVYAPIVAILRASAMPLLDAVWLTELARLLPELRTEHPELPRPGPMREAWQRQHLFEAMARAVLSGRQPLLLRIEDVQWCDNETLEWLRYLLHYQARAKLLVVATMRIEEIIPHHALQDVLSALRQSAQLVVIDLGPLNEAETATLAAQVAGLRLTQASATSLHQETEGNPLFIVEVARAHHANLGIPTSGRNPPGGIPPRVQAVLAARLAQVSAPAHELLSVAAVIGRAFTFEVLRQVSGASDDTIVRSLDELWQRRIIRERGDDGYDFSHDKLRETAYAGLGAARRRVLHRQVAEALEKLYARNLDSVSREIAAHYAQASLPEPAMRYYRQAAEAMRRAFANQAALVSLRQAMALCEQQLPEPGARSLLSPMHEDEGDILCLIAQYATARAAYQSATQYAVQEDHVQRARLQRKLGNTLALEHLVADALALYQTAEQILNDDGAVRDTAWWQEWIQVQIERLMAYYWRADNAAMSQVIESMAGPVQRDGTAAQQAAFLECQMLMQLRLDRFGGSAASVDIADRRLAVVEQLGDPAALGSARFQLGLCQLWYGDLDEAQRWLAAGLDLTRRTGDVLVRTRCLSYLTVTARRRGDVNAVRRLAAESLTEARAAQIHIYAAMARANQAWLAWRDGDLPSVRENGQSALAAWRDVPDAFPAQWLACWPLLAAALAAQDVSEAVGLARRMLDPSQFIFAPDLTADLEQAIQAWERGLPDAAQASLQAAALAAQTLGYL